MSLINRNIEINENKKCKKEYSQQYRKNNLQILKLKERTKYHKRNNNLSDAFCSLYGEYSGDVYKIKKEFNQIKNTCPELIEHILQLLHDEATN